LIICRAVQGLLHMAAQFVRSRAVAQGEFEQHRDLCEATAEIVVNVFGDAGSFTVQGSLLFERLQLNAIPTGGNEEDAAGDNQRKAPQEQERNHQVCQKKGNTVNPSVAPFSFQMPALLQALTRK